MSRADALASFAILLIGVPLAYMFASATVDGNQRYRETPLRGLLGSDVYEALASGDPIQQHYMGDELLAPDFELQDADGSTWRLSDHRGEVVVMNFWSVTCGPCIEEMPTLIELARILRERDGIELVTIAGDRDWAQVRAVVPDGSGLRVLLDPDREVVRDQYGTRLYPETWIVDPRGVIRLRLDGARDWSGSVAIDVIESYL